MEEQEYGYAKVADEIFAPIFPIIADAVVSRTGLHSGRMLDIGCGVGHLGLSVLQRTDMQGFFMDSNPRAVALCREKAEEWNLADRTTVTVGDVHALPYEDNFADLIVSRSSIGFWKDAARAFAEIYRVLAPGGKTYVGAGLGDAETQAKIREQMKSVDPEWPGSVKRKQIHVSTDRFCEIFEALGCRFRVVENKAEGRWFILEKD